MIYVNLDVDTRHNGDAEEGESEWLYQGSNSAYLGKIDVSIEDNNKLGYTRNSFDLDLKPGDIVFLVIVKYQTGGTFGSEERFLLVDIFTDHEKAYDLRKAIEQDYEENPNFDFKAKDLTVNGKEYYVNEWKGHFEVLLDVHVYTEMVNA